MPKFFVMSDIHGFYNKMIEALDNAGFDKDNPDHWVVTCGDHFDRGGQALQVMKYLDSLPRKILVRGNHEQLLEYLCERGFPYSYDKSNGTFSTVCQLGLIYSNGEIDYDYVLARVKPFFKQMVNYFETKNHIFVHSWIPVDNENGVLYRFKEDWREASDDEWDNSRWGNPYDMAAKGLLPDKTVVFGHWHCSTGWAEAEGRSEFGEDAKFDPYYGDGFISIDACTAYSGKVNVVVIEDEFLEE